MASRIITKTARLFFKTALILIGLFVAMIFVLFMIGGKGEIYRGGVESFIETETGYEARIGTFNNMSFFPRIGMSFADLKLYEPGIGDEEIPPDRSPVASLGSVDLYFGFWDLVMGRGTFHQIDLAGGYAAPGAFIAKAVRLDRTEIVPSEENNAHAAFRAVGAIGEQDAVLEVPLSVNRRGSVPVYSLAGEKDRHFTLKVGDLKVTGRPDERLTLYRGETKLVSAGVNLDFPDRTLRLQGDIETENSSLEGQIRISRSVKKTSVQGHVTAQRLFIRDIDMILQTIDEIQDVVKDPPAGQKELKLTDMDLDLDLEIQKLVAKELSLGSLSGPLSISGGVLTFPVEGEISKGRLSGNLELKAPEPPFALTSDIQINGLDYGELQSRLDQDVNISGTGDLRFQVSSNGTMAEDIWRNADGNFVFIGGKGRLNAGVLNLWGGGLVNAMLPDFSAEEDFNMNCLIMDFEIEQGMAEANAFFADTNRLTVVGEGSYNIPDNNLNMQLKPETKDIAIGDVATAINISGPIQSPAISPSAFSLGKKLGTLLLGTINPAFLAFSLTDLGLTDSHPCADYIKAPAADGQ